jgi:hypothetical protein
MFPLKLGALGNGIKGGLFQILIGSTACHLVIFGGARVQKKDNQIIGPETNVGSTLEVEDIYQARCKDSHPFGRAQHHFAVVLLESKALSITSNT